MISDTLVVASLLVVVVVGDTRETRETLCLSLVAVASEVATTTASDESNQDI